MPPAGIIKHKDPDFMTNPSGSAPPAPSGGGDGGGILGALIGLGATIYSGETQKRNVDKTNAANKALAEYAYARDLEMWNRMNDYNSPEAQMARLKAAGLNPNMIYGQGAGGAGNASQMPKYNAPTVKYDYIPMVDIPAALGMYQDFSMRQAQIDNVKAQTESTRTRTLTEGIRQGVLRLAGEKTQRQLDVHMPYEAGILHNKAKASSTMLESAMKGLAMQDQKLALGRLEQEYKSKQIGLTGIEMEKRAAEAMFAKYKAQWAQMGITTSDNIALRALVRMMSEAGFNVGAMFSGIMK